MEGHHLNIRTKSPSTERVDSTYTKPDRAEIANGLETTKSIKLPVHPIPLHASDIYYHERALPAVRPRSNYASALVSPIRSRHALQPEARKPQPHWLSPLSVNSANWGRQWLTSNDLTQYESKEETWKAIRHNGHEKSPVVKREVLDSTFVSETK